MRSREEILDRIKEYKEQLQQMEAGFMLDDGGYRSCGLRCKIADLLWVLEDSDGEHGSDRPVA